MGEIQIVTFRAHCSAFQQGYCWGCENPHYTGHYETEREAIEAAHEKLSRARRRSLTEMG